MLEELQEIYVHITGHSDIILTEKTKVKTELGMTSLELVSLICAIEETFQIKIPNRMLRKFKTVGDVISFVESEK